MTKYFIFIFYLFFVCNLFAQHDNLKSGDLLFQDLDCGGFCDAIEKVTPAYNNKHFSHVGILLNSDSKNWVVCEAISKGVIITPLDSFINRTSKENIYIGRIKNIDVKLPTYNDLKKYIGSVYDSVFDINNKAYYCSELVYFLYKDKHNKPIFELKPMTYNDPENGKLFPIWDTYFKKINYPIPEGKLGLNPGSIINSNKINVWKFNNN